MINIDRFFIGVIFLLVLSNVLGISKILNRLPVTTTCANLGLKHEAVIIQNKARNIVIQCKRGKK